MNLFPSKKDRTEQFLYSCLFAEQVSNSINQYMKQCKYLKVVTKVTHMYHSQVLEKEVAENKGCL